MIKKFLASIVVVCLISGFSFAQHNNWKYNYHTNRAAVHNYKASLYAAKPCCGHSISNFQPTTGISPLIYRPPLIQQEIIVPRPYVYHPHVYHGKVYRNLHFDKTQAKIYHGVKTMKPY